MSYNDYDQSIQDSIPAELYELTYGDGKVIRTTSHDENITIDGVEYLAMYHERDTFIDDGKPDDQSQLNIKVSVDHPFIPVYENQELRDTVLVKVKAVNLLDPDMQVYHKWSGRLTGLSYDFPYITIGCEKIAASLHRTGCRARYARQCFRCLYQYGCNVNKESFMVPVQITSVRQNGYIVGYARIPGSQNYDKLNNLNYLVGGMIMFDGMLRTILTSVNGSIRLSQPLKTLKAGEVVSLYPGCDRSSKMCKERFGNLDNYGGFDFMPAKGPFQGVSIL